MKRYLSLILIAVMMLGTLVGCNSSSEKAKEFTFPDAEYAVNATDFAIVGDKIYYISGGAVYEIGADEPIFTEFPAQYLSSNGAELAIYGNGQIWCGDKTYTTAQTDITSFVYADGTFCWSWQNEDLPQIGFYNVKTGDTISVNPLTGAECKVLPYRNSDILILCYELDGTMVLYDYNTETMKPGTMLIQDIIKSCAYNAADDSFVYISSAGNQNTRMTVLKNGERESKQYTPCEPMRDSMNKCLFSAGSAVFLDESGTIYIRKVFAEGEFQNTVTVIVNDQTDFFGERRITELCETIFEQYGIEVVIQRHSDHDKITQKQLAGDDDYDLYFTNGLNVVLQYPVYEPLNDYPKIMEQFDAMLDEVKDVCTYNGNIFGVPTMLDVSPSIIGYNADLLKKLGLSLPDPGWTLEDFYEMAVKVRDGGAYISSFTPLWSGIYIMQYGNTNFSIELTDDGTILRDMLEINKKLKTEGLLYDPKTSPANAEVLFFVDNASAGFITTECDVWYKPTFDGTRIDYSYAKFLHMNVHSKNKSQAAQVIAEFMRERSTDYPTFGWTFYKGTAENLRKSSEKSARNMDIFQELLSTLKPGPAHGDFWIFANEQEQKYYNDEQDLEYTAEQLYARAKMIFEE